MKTVRVCISGRVQGVWFRGWTETQANSYGLDGWVRNLWDGSVEALFSGEETNIDQMIAACHVGPPASRVDEVLVDPDDREVPLGFSVRATE